MIDRGGSDSSPIFIFLNIAHFVLCTKMLPAWGQINENEKTFSLTESQNPAGNVCTN